MESAETRDDFKAFNQFLKKLADRFEPLQVLSFSKNRYIHHSESCFKNSRTDEECDYCLLVITGSSPGSEHEIQEFANSTYQNGMIAVICHTLAFIEEAIMENNYFFISVMASGKLVYSSGALLHRKTYPRWNGEKAAAGAQQHIESRFPLARAFLNSAENSIEKERYNTGILLLHQAAEQCFIGLISVMVGYHPQFHNINRLLMLTTCFSDRPRELLHSTPEYQRLFVLLAKSYSAFRYKPDFNVSKKDAETLVDMVSAFISLSISLCLERVSSFEPDSLKCDMPEIM